MALYPYRNVKNLYQLASPKPPFLGLATQPNDWTIGISYTSSNFALSIATTSYSPTSASIDIDASGKVWFPTNLGGSKNTNLNGIANFDPTATSFNGPYLGSAGYVQPQYVAIDSNAYAWVTDVGSGGIAGYTDTVPNTGHQGLFLAAPFVLGPIASDSVGDTFFTFIDPNQGIPRLAETAKTLSFKQLGSFTEPPTGLVATESFIYASTSGIGTPCKLEYTNTSDNTIVQATTSSNCTSGGVAFAEAADDSLGMATSLDEFCFLQEQGCGGPPSAFTADVNLPEGVATDGHGNEWIANAGNASVFTFGGVFTNYANSSTVAYLHGSNHGSTMTTPYAIAIDGSGNVWIANAGCVSTTTTACTPGAFVLSELIGAAGPTVTPLSAQMADGGFLVGQVPGTLVPTSAGSAHPDRLAPSSNGQSAPTSWSEATGKPLIFLR